MQFGSLQQEQVNQLIAFHHNTDTQDNLEKIYEESKLGCDHTEKEAKAQICNETPLIPKGVTIPSAAAGRARSLLAQLSIYAG